MGGCASRPKDLKGETLDELPIADVKCVSETPVANVDTEPIVENKVETCEITKEEPLIDLAEPEEAEKTKEEEAVAERNVGDDKVTEDEKPEEAATTGNDQVEKSEENVVTEGAVIVTEGAVIEEKVAMEIAVKEEKPAEKEEEVVVQSN